MDAVGVGPDPGGGRVKAENCALCGGENAYPTAEPTIVDPWEPAAMRHPTVAQHHRRVLATDTPLCAGCMELISFLPAVALGAEAF